MDSFLGECFDQAFSQENLNKLWSERNSKVDILSLESDYPIRNKLNDHGSRTVELFSQSEFGFFSYPLALVLGEKLCFPNEFTEFVVNRDLIEFERAEFHREVDILIGAFSILALKSALKNKDFDFETNNIQYELVKTDQGSMQCFAKVKEGLEAFSPLAVLERSELDGKPLVIFDTKDGKRDVLPTQNTEKWIRVCISQRLLQLWTIERP
ncbi:MAG: hypothetical protein U5L96_12465 [Owenweeksia sp.]|nr:hypothetical protein [Owenweeksia sp.]